MKDSRGPWYLLSGLFLGILIGFVYAWVINPARYENPSPAYLEPAAKAEYRRLIAVAYAANRDLRRAEARLAILQDPDPSRTLAEQAQQIVAAGGSLDDARALALLASALGTQPQPISPTSPP